MSPWSSIRLQSYGDLNLNLSSPSLILTLVLAWEDNGHIGELWSQQGSLCRPHGILDFHGREVLIWYKEMESVV